MNIAKSKSKTNIAEVNAKVELGWCLGDAQNALRTLKEHPEVNTGDWYTWMTEVFLPSEIERLS